MAKTTTPLTVSPATMSMEIGGTATLVASSTKGVIVGATWSSSNKALAYVNRDTGLVTALVAGTATITATYHGSKATSKVTVLAAPVSDLAITCPGDQTVTGTGALTVVKLGPIQTTGGVAPIVITFNPQVGTGFPIGTTLVTATAVSADTQRATCQYSVTVTGSYPAPPAPLTVTCPAPVVVYSPDGDPLAVTFAATTTGGTDPITITYSPASGSTFAVGTTGVVATATSTDGQTAICSFAVTVKDPSDSSLRGPQATITCPVGSVRITTGASIQAAINASPAGTSFCIAAGTHTIAAPIVPKSGNSFVGEFGAILDGTGWTSSDLDDGFFRSINTGVTGVTIKNLVIRDGPQYGVNAYLSSSGWTVTYCEISGNVTGVSVGTAGVISHNYIHHNVGVPSSNPAERGGGIVLGGSEGAQIIDNEVAYNGVEQKTNASGGGLNRSIYIAHNWYHHNDGNGIWNDGDGAGTIIEYNTVEDHSNGAGIDVEYSNGVIVRNNIVRRNTGGEGIYITVTKNATITGNTLSDNLFGIGLFLDFVSLYPNSPQAAWHQDLADNTISGNTVHASVGQKLGYFVLSNKGLGGTSPTAYETNAKNNDWSSNTYFAPDTSSNWFQWDSVNKTFTTWQALPQDAGATITVE